MWEVVREVILWMGCFSSPLGFISRGRTFCYTKSCILTCKQGVVTAALPRLGAALGSEVIYTRQPSPLLQVLSLDMERMGRIGENVKKKSQGNPDLYFNFLLN